MFLVVIIISAYIRLLLDIGLTLPFRTAYDSVPLNPTTLCNLYNVIGPSDGSGRLPRYCFQFVAATKELFSPIGQRFFVSDSIMKGNTDHSSLHRWTTLRFFMKPIATTSKYHKSLLATHSGYKSLYLDTEVFSTRRHYAVTQTLPNRVEFGDQTCSRSWTYLVG